MLMKGGSPGYVSEGVTNRDSVNALLARDEYVVCGKSVRGLGVAFMNAINEHGSKALDKLGGAPIMIGAGGRQEMNVYIVKPDEKPQMWPNDVLLAIADDILQGGTTTQLIRRVSQRA